jgi:ribosomal subunit interface protein
MKLTITGKQIDLGDALRSHVGESLDQITGKYFNGAIDATVAFSRQSHLYRADLSVHVSRNIVMQSSGEAVDPYLAFDQASDRLAKRLRRHKRRLADHHRDLPAEPSLPAQAYILEMGAEEVTPGADGTADVLPAEAVGEAAADEDGDGAEADADRPVVVAEMTTPIDMLTVSQAVMRLDLGDLPALMFRNRAHGGLNMVYRRPDGNVGWVDPQGTSQAGL